MPHSCSQTKGRGLYPALEERRLFKALIRFTSRKCKNAHEQNSAFVEEPHRLLPAEASWAWGPRAPFHGQACVTHCLDAEMLAKQEAPCLAEMKAPLPGTLPKRMRKLSATRHLESWVVTPSFAHLTRCRDSGSWVLAHFVGLLLSTGAARAYPGDTEASFQKFWAYHTLMDSPMPPTRGEPALLTSLTQPY